MNISFILHTAGRISIILGMFMAILCFGFTIKKKNSSTLALIYSILIALTLGLVLMVMGRRKKQVSLVNRYILVTFSWFLIGILGSLSFYISGHIPNFIDALFESISGFSTTGASILTNVEALPYSILYWRSLTHWIGGMGIIVLVIAVFPMFKTSGYQMFSLDASGLLNQKLKPRTSDIAKRLWFIYVMLAALLVTLLMLGT